MNLRITLVPAVLAFGCGILLYSQPATSAGMCPEGYYPIGGGDAGWEGCAPLPGGPEQESDEPEPKWATRWGAVATTNGAFGFSHSWASEEQAVGEALAQCSRDAGGATCTLKQSYHDQCIALAWGQRGSYTVAGPFVEQAEQLAIENCATRTTNCRVFYSGCSLPERVQ